MKCIRCNEDMTNTLGGNYHCQKCGFAINDLVYRGNDIGIADCTPHLPDDIVNNLPDDVIIAPNLTTPEEPHYPREEYRTQVGELYCLICGKPFPWYWGESHRIIICDECKRAIAWAKEKMKEKEG